MFMEKEFKKFAEDFALKAGQVIRENFGLGMSKQWKKDNTPVTEADLRINSLLIKEVQTRFPGHSIIGEEESSQSGNSEYAWVCDPVDGTIPFSHGIPVSTFSLALTKNGESILGVVLDPFQEHLFSAVKEQGAFLNGQPIHVSNTTNFRGLGSYEIFAEMRYDTSKLIEHLRLKEKVKLISLASIIYPSVLVAAGELLFTVFPHDTAHDAAAVKVIVEEAGGKVTDLFGNDQRYDRPTKGFIASNGYLHAQLVELAKKFIGHSPPGGRPITRKSFSNP